MANPLIALRGLILVIPWAIYLIISDLIWSLLLPVGYLFPDAAYNACSFVANTNWSWIQAIFEFFNGGKITISGDELPQGESAIIISNHVSWTDFYMIQKLAQKSRMLGRNRWFAKAELKYVPLLGWGIWSMGMPMVSRKWLQDQKELDRVFNGIVVRKWPTWLISFAEGTRFTSKKYEQAKEWCKANDRPVPKHLLYPRTKGFVTTVQQLRKSTHVKAVYDMAIAYEHNHKFQEAPTIWESLSLNNLSGARGYKFHVHVLRFPLNELPETDAELAKWLEKRWIEKGQYLEEKKEEWARLPVSSGHSTKQKVLA